MRATFVALCLIAACGDNPQAPKPVPTDLSGAWSVRDSVFVELNLVHDLTTGTANGLFGVGTTPGQARLTVTSGRIEGTAYLLGGRPCDLIAVRGEAVPGGVRVTLDQRGMMRETLCPGEPARFQGARFTLHR